jgi:hypothetical protein
LILGQALRQRVGRSPDARRRVIGQAIDTRPTPAHLEFELAWAPHLITTMDYTYRERHGEVIYRFKNGMFPSEFFRRNVVLSFPNREIARLGKR